MIGSFIAFPVVFLLILISSCCYGCLRIIIEDLAGVDFRSDIMILKMISPKATFSRCHFIFFSIWNFGLINRLNCCCAGASVPWPGRG